jgi:hypothetical protein
VRCLSPSSRYTALTTLRCRWVPVVRVGGKVCIFPGVPRLFERLVEGLVSHYVPLPPASEKPYRVLVHTECVTLYLLHPYEY